MNDTEDMCGCLACAALCGICCVAAAEEDKRERERAAAAAVAAYEQIKTPAIQVQPVPAHIVSPRSQKTYHEEYMRAQGDARTKKRKGYPPPPPAYY